MTKFTETLEVFFEVDKEMKSGTYIQSCLQK
jgi:hypothetical protein